MNSRPSSTATALPETNSGPPPGWPAWNCCSPTAQYAHAGGSRKPCADELKALWRYPTVGDIRQVGLVAGVELVRNWRTRQPFDLRERVGIRVCEAMARQGVLTRPIGNVVVLMPPYCTTPAEARRMVAALGEAVMGLPKSR